MIATCFAFCSRRHSRKMKISRRSLMRTCLTTPYSCKPSGTIRNSTESKTLISSKQTVHCARNSASQRRLSIGSAVVSTSSCMRTSLRKKACSRSSGSPVSAVAQLVCCPPQKTIIGTTWWSNTTPAGRTAPKSRHIRCREKKTIGSNQNSASY